MFKVQILNPIVTMVAAMVAVATVAIGQTYVQVTRPTFVAVRGWFSLPPPNSNRFVASSQRGVSIAGFVIGIAVAALVTAIILPIAFGQFFAVDTSSWDAQTILIWAVIPLVVILAIVLFFLNKADDQA